MKRLGNVLLLAAIAVALLGYGVARWGIRHEVAKIPEATRARMADTDMIGLEWAVAGAFLFLAACAMAVAGGLARFVAAFQAWRAEREGAGERR